VVTVGVSFLSILEAAMGGRYTDSRGGEIVSKLIVPKDVQMNRQRSAADLGKGRRGQQHPTFQTGWR